MQQTKHTLYCEEVIHTSPQHTADTSCDSCYILLGTKNSQEMSSLLFG